MKKKIKSKKPLSKKELADLWCKVDSEGFGYYMLFYGPDLDAIERLGFNRSEVESAIKILKDISEKISEGEEYADEQFE